MPNSNFEQYIKTLKQINYLTVAMQNCTSIAEVLNTMLEECISIIDASSGSVMFRHSQSDQLYFYAHKNIPQSVIDSTEMNIKDGIAGTVTHTGIPQIINDITLDPKYIAIHDNILSEMAVPLKINNYNFGVIVLDSDQKNKFTDKHLEFIQMIATQTSFIINYFIQKAFSDKYRYFLETFLALPTISNAKEIFSQLAEALNVTGACIINEKQEVIFSHGTLKEEIDPNASLFTHPHSFILKSKNHQNIPYTRLVVPRENKDMSFIADKCYYFADSTTLDLLFSDKVLSLLSTKDPLFGNDNAINDYMMQWIDKKLLEEPGMVYDIAINEIEKNLIEKALMVNKANKLKTAHFLGMNRNTLRHKMDMFNLN